MANVYKGRAHRERVSTTEGGRKVARRDDYKRRSALFKRKRAMVRAARKAADAKNPDEFHFAMEHARTAQDGSLVFKEKSLTPEAARRAIDTSRRVVRYEASMEAAKLERANASAALSIALPPGGVRTFVDSDDEDQLDVDAPVKRGRFAAVCSPDDVRRENAPVVVSDAQSMARPAVAAAVRQEMLARKQRASRLKLHALTLDEKRRRTALKRVRSVSVGPEGAPAKRRRVVLNRQLRSK